MADEPGVVTDYASLLRYQLEYKVSLRRRSPWYRLLTQQAMIIQTDRPLRCLLTLLLPSLAKPRKEERDEKIISLGLHIVRNLLAVKDSVAEGHAIGEKEELASLQVGLSLYCHACRLTTAVVPDCSARQAYILQAVLDVGLLCGQGGPEPVQRACPGHPSSGVPRCQAKRHRCRVRQGTPALPNDAVVD